MTLLDPTVELAGHVDRPALRRCVSVDPAEFAARYWGSRPLLSGNHASGFTDLLDLAAVDELIAERGLRTPFLRVVKEGRVLAVDRYTGGGGAGAEVADQVLDERIVGLVADGATLVLQGLHRVWPPLVDFAVRLRTDVGHPVQVNAYLTPAGNRGLATHYDTHDVFVLQVAGRKRWLVHPPVLAHPLPRQPWGGHADEVTATATSPATVDSVLNPGDALYLPRGWLHRAEAVGEVSLHLTVGVKTISRYALVELLLELAAEDPALRVPLPLGVEVAEPADIADDLAATVAVLRDWLGTVTAQEVADHLRARYWPASRPAPLRPLVQAETIRSLTTETRVRVRPGLRWQLRGERADRVVLGVFDRSVSFPAQCEAALRQVLGGSPWRVGSLAGLDHPDDCVVLVRRLLCEGIVVTAD
jgi:ribosomal protein L16 Arg81 hydroxylase